MEASTRFLSRASKSVWLRAMVLVFVSTLAAAPGVAVQAEPKPGKAPAAAKVAVKGGPADRNALWWNDKKIVKQFSLTDEQRKKMDDCLTSYREKVPEPARRAAFHEALVQGKWDEARAELEKLARLADESVRTRGKLKLDVLSLLTQEQHKKLVDGYPLLIYKPWTRAMRLEGR